MNTPELDVDDIRVGDVVRRPGSMTLWRITEVSDCRFQDRSDTWYREIYADSLLSSRKLVAESSRWFTLVDRPVRVKKKSKKKQKKVRL